MKIITNRWGRNAQQGVKVWVMPLVGCGKHKRSTHRVLAECPQCGTHLSVGRLHQHKCPTIKSKGLPTSDPTPTCEATS